MILSGPVAVEFLQCLSPDGGCNLVEGERSEEWADFVPLVDAANDFPGVGILPVSGN